ncbi:hypothetical protein B9G69_000435 [Bdellovibrio sp. SKB1291214]|uniref:hypothetical protein n=1 Tax=Bdellovibrio sp. SKB1291214 TaxID=1732569 RepID=UPI000B514FB1|nr:hypothetical protein [Bdellovibrio sp. SKB1291214]UYL09041.1 hypothetical protein B9G69_000435 [Bdellovibrio sp. SKB1291214]
MSNTLKILLSSVLLCFSTSALAVGDEVQNGGDVIACPSLEVPIYKSLDLYEGKMVYGLEPALIQQNDFRVIVSQLIDRIAKFDTTRANLYRSFLRNLSDEGRMVPGSEFGNIKDEGFITLPEGCSLKQAAGQFQKHTPEGIKYIFNGAIWNEMKPIPRAALVMHEFVYREVLMQKNAPPTSVKVRYFNAFIHSKKMLNSSNKEYSAAAAFAGLNR